MTVGASQALFVSLQALIEQDDEVLPPPAPVSPCEGHLRCPCKGYLRCPCKGSVGAPVRDASGAPVWDTLRAVERERNNKKKCLDVCLHTGSSQGHNLGGTVSCVPSLLDRSRPGSGLVRRLSNMTTRSRRYRANLPPISQSRPRCGCCVEPFWNESLQKHLSCPPPPPIVCGRERCFLF